jgi:hypothetical protein
MPIFDLTTGEVHAAHLFVAALRASSYIYSEVDEELLTRHVRLPHRRCEALPPFAVKLTAARIAVTIRNFDAILLPQDHQRHTAPLRLLVHLDPIRNRASLVPDHRAQRRGLPGADALVWAGLAAVFLVHPQVKLARDFGLSIGLVWWLRMLAKQYDLYASR